MMKTKIKKPKESEEIAHLKNQLARALADYDNLTKRVERQSEMFGTLAKTHLVTRLLPAIDMLYDASRHLNDRVW